MKKCLLSMIALLFLIASLIGCAPQQHVKAIPENLVWPPSPQTPRIKLIASYDSRFDVVEERAMMRALGEEPDTRLVRPQGIAVDNEGNMFVSDVGFRVLKLYAFYFQRKQFKVIGGSGPERIKLPLGLGIDVNRGLLFVVDSGDKQVKVYDKDTGRLQFIIGQKPGTFQRPVAVAVDSARQIVYVADTKRHNVQAFNYQGDFMFSIGKGGRSIDDDGFNVPTSLALDSKGNLYVADMFNRYIKVFNSEGTFVKKIGQGVGMGMGSFSKLSAVALDSEDHVYGLDVDLCNFQIFDQDNNLLLFVGKPGNDHESLWTPSVIFIDGQDRIYVTDTMNQRVQVYQYLSTP